MLSVGFKMATSPLPNKSSREEESKGEAVSFEISSLQFDLKRRDKESSICVPTSQFMLQYLKVRNIGM